MVPNSLTAKARTAFNMAMAAHTGSPVHHFALAGHIKKTMVENMAGTEDVLAEGILVLIGLAGLGVNIDEMLADILWQLESHPGADDVSIVRSAIQKRVEVL